MEKSYKSGRYFIHDCWMWIKYYLGATGSPFGLQTIFVAFPIALIILIAVSLATQPKSE